jgi:phage-related protein
MTFYNKIHFKSVRFHRRVENELNAVDVFTRSKIYEVLEQISKGNSIGLPLSRPMPIVAHGAHELRIGNPGGQYRVFYFLKMKEEIFVFHFFKKKTQKTPKGEIETAKKRLRDML